nr:MAG TPA: hypothetical protein [Caudoviricetes sp.]
MNYLVSYLLTIRVLNGILILEKRKERKWCKRKKHKSVK